MPRTLFSLPPFYQYFTNFHACVSKKCRLTRHSLRKILSTAASMYVHGLDYNIGHALNFSCHTYCSVQKLIFLLRELLWRELTKQGKWKIEISSTTTKTQHALLLLYARYASSLLTLSRLSHRTSQSGCVSMFYTPIYFSRRHTMCICALCGVEVF